MADASASSNPLLAIARWLFPLVRGHIEWWRDAIRRWAADPPRHKIRGLLPFSERLNERRIDTETSPLPVPFQEQVLTLDERIVLLAAIHDEYADGLERIDPWLDLPQLGENADRALLDEYGLAIAYAAVRRRVQKLLDCWADHSAKIELFIDDVEQLMNAGLLTKEADQSSQESGKNDDGYVSTSNAENSRNVDRRRAPKTAAPKIIGMLLTIHEFSNGRCGNYSPFYLAQQEFQKSILDSQAGATRQALTKELIENFIIAAPPLAEQKRIAKILKAQLATVDQARTAAEAQLNAAKALPAVYLRDIFRPEHTTGWTRGHIGEVTDIMPGQHILESDYNREKRGIGYLTGPADFGQFRAIVSKWTEKPKVFCEPRDVLVTVKGAGVGKINFAPTERCAIGRQLMAVRRKNGALEQTFLFYSLFIKFRDLQAAALGATVPGLGRVDISNLEIAAPHIDEQRRIIALMTQRLEYSGP